MSKLLQLNKDDSLCEPIKSLVKDCIKDIEKLYDQQSDEEPRCAKSIGDQIVQNIAPGGVAFLFSESKSGSTSFHLKALCELEISGHTTLYSSPSLDRKQIILRLLAMKSGIPLCNIQKGVLKHSDFPALVNAAGHLAEQKTYFSKRCEFNPDWLRQELKLSRNDRGVFLIDDCCYMASVDLEKLSTLSSSLKELAFACQARIIATIKIKSIDDFFLSSKPVPGLSGFFSDKKIPAIFLKREQRSVESILISNKKEQEEHLSMYLDENGALMYYDS